MDRSRSTAATAIFAGGVVAVVAFIPFTLAHGPTSYDLEREVLGWDMLQWGFLMGTIPELLVGAGLWRLRGLLAGDSRVAIRALTVMCIAMFLFAAMNVAVRAIGPPFDLFLLAPACLVAAKTTATRGALRGMLSVLAAAYCVALAIGLLPQETSDSFGGFRIFGLIAYAGVGALWAVLGARILWGAAIPADLGN
jgi:hypothetical protein